MDQYYYSDDMTGEGVGLTPDCWMLLWLGTPGQAFSDCSDSSFMSSKKALMLKKQINLILDVSDPCGIIHLLATSAIHRLQERKREKKKIRLKWVLAGNGCIYHQNRSQTYYRVWVYFCIYWLHLMTEH